MIELHLETQQINSLCIGTKLATELKCSDEKFRKFLTIQGYRYNAQGKISKLDKTMNTNIRNDIFFELHCYEISDIYYINHWDVTEDDLVNEIYKDDIKGITALEKELIKYLNDFSLLKPEWYCDSLL